VHCWSIKQLLGDAHELMTQFFALHSGGLAAATQVLIALISVTLLMPLGVYEAV